MRAHVIHAKRTAANFGKDFSALRMVRTCCHVAGFGCRGSSTLAARAAARNAWRQIGDEARLMPVLV